MAEKKVYRFLTIARAVKKEQRAPDPGRSLCPGNGARSALRSLLSVALSSVRALPFYHAGLFLPLDGFSI
jgi:hypothetical protein